MPTCVASNGRRIPCDTLAQTLQWTIGLVVVLALTGATLFVLGLALKCFFSIDIISNRFIIGGAASVGLLLVILYTAKHGPSYFGRRRE